MWKKSPEPEEFRPQANPVTQPSPAPAPKVSSAPQARDYATIGSTITIKGDLSGEEDLLMEGKLEGKIELRRHCVTIGKNGRIKGDVFGKVITVEGTVEGNLYGEEQLILRQAGTVRGNIVAPRVALEDGSNFKGSIDMSPKEKPAAALQDKVATAAKSS